MKKTTAYIVIVAALTHICWAVEQPISTVSYSGDTYIPYDPDGGSFINVSTSQRPLPDCDGDTANGDPDFFWDFGSLSGIDNADGTAKIENNTPGEYQVKVHCTQEYTYHDGGGSYTNETKQDNQNQQNAVIQIPGTVSFVGSSGGTTSVTYNFILQDQSSARNPIKNKSVQIYENLGTRTMTWKTATGAIFHTQTDPPANGNQAFHGTTSGSGGWSDVITMGPASINYLLQALGQTNPPTTATLEHGSYAHNYISATYLGTSYTFSPPLNQNKTYNFIVTATPKTGGGYTLAYSTSNVTP